MNGVPKKSHLRFGIPPLDDLFGTYSLSHRADGIPILPNEHARLAIVGPAGSGKSILSLHLASRYAADLYTRRAEEQAGKPSASSVGVIYISTDLTYEKADSMWKAFRLNRPNLREIPFYRTNESHLEQLPIRADEVSLEARLVPLSPFADPPAGLYSLANFLRCKPKRELIEIGFVDLLKTPVGDVWKFTSSLLATLDGSQSADQSLIFVDNVEGFEAEVGEVNAFGEASSVRARIMQALKAARGKAHLVFASEDHGSGNETLVEESDVVIRLHLPEKEGYLYRSIEVQKARAQAIHRGEHYLIFRTGSGSTTGQLENADDPRTANAYVQVYPSLHTVNRRVMNEPTSLRHQGVGALERRAGFGLRYLDEMCGGAPSYEDDDAPVDLKNDHNGLGCGTLTGIIGDPNTYKTPLGQKFLLRPFELFAENLDLLFREELKTDVLCRRIRDAKKERFESESSGESLLDRHRKIATPEGHANFATALLIMGRGANDGVWDGKEIKKKIETIHGGPVPPDLALLCAQWLARLLASRLKRLIQSPDAGAEAGADILRQPFVVPHGIRELRQIAESVSRGDYVTWEAIASAAFAYWSHSRSFARGMTAKQQYDFENDEPQPLDDPSRILETVGKISRRSRRRSRGSTGPPQDFIPRSGDRSKREIWLRELPGSKSHYKPNLDATELTTREALLLMVGMEIEWIHTQPSGSETEIRKWLRSVSELQPIFGSRNPEVFSRCIVECYSKYATEAEQSEALRLIGDINGPVIPSPNPFPRDVLPQVVDPADPLSKERFAAWLFQSTPRTHPYAHQNGEKALFAAISARQSPGSLSPVFCSVVVALTLNLIRERRINLKGHAEDELRSRREACESIGCLLHWIGQHIDKVKGEPRSARCLVAIRGICVRVRDNWLEILAMKSCRRALSDAEGTFIPNAASGGIAERLRSYRLLLEAAAQEGLTDGPSLLVTTKDIRLETLRDKYLLWLNSFLSKNKYSPETQKHFRAIAQEHFDQWMIVRRLEVHFLNTTALTGIVRINVEACHRLLFAIADRRGDKGEWATNINERRRVSAGIRLVVDSLTDLRQTYPSIVDDPLFMPGFRFFVSRENLTAIVLSSQKGRPSEAGEDAFERETNDLFLTHIRLWRVLFFGGLRVAITVVPPPPEHGTARVRELTISRNGELEIAPHFELYRNLEQGQPEAVALEVRLIGENKLVTKYQAMLDSVLAETFPTAGKTPRAQVVRADRESQWVTQLRDFGRLHRESRLDHTLVLEADEYWAFGRSDAFRRQASYLYSKCGDDPGFHRTDPLEVFQGTLADSHELEKTRAARFCLPGPLIKSADKRRRKAEYEHMDRIPFMWDFGFLLCDRTSWRRSSNLELSVATKNYGSPIDVPTVWYALNNPGERPAVRTPPTSATPPLTSWRFVLEAAVEISSRRSASGPNHAPALDLPVIRGESIVCLLLEMWASEVYLKYCRPTAGFSDLVEPYFKRFTHRSWLPNHTQGIISLLAEPASSGASLKKIFTRALAQGKLPTLSRHCLELYKVLILLREAFDASSIVPGEEESQFRSRAVSPNAICARHWYPTASEFLAGVEDAERYVAVRLPGHFSVRGDSFLAVAQGSQSSLLADRALDLLSSRRGNHERLRFGLGLPVRDIADDVAGNKLRTRIPMVDRLGRRTWMRYKELTALGADETPRWDQEGFHWLWRSALGDYDAQARALHSGTYRIMEWWKDLRVLRSPGWKSGFHLYDMICKYFETDDEEEKRKIFRENFEIYSLWEFPEICDELIDRLRHATPKVE